MMIQLVRHLLNACQRIRRHPLRSGLLALTFALGLSSVVSIVGTIEGGRTAIRHDLTALLIGNVDRDFGPLFAAAREFAEIPDPLPHGGPLTTTES